jgi:hypothetical protein
VDIISDRNSRFISKIWKSFVSTLSSRIQMLTAFYPQTEGQAERLNQTNTLSLTFLACGYWILAVFEDCKQELEKSIKRTKKYTNQHCLEPPTFKPGKLVMFNRKIIKTQCPACKLNHKMYYSYSILNNISSTVVCLLIPKTWKIYRVFYISLIEPFLKGNQDVDLNPILKTSAPIENVPKYEVDKVMGSKENDGKLVYVVKWKS